MGDAFNSAEEAADAVIECADSFESNNVSDYLMTAAVRIKTDLTALRAENARLRTGLDSMLRIFREETSSGDGIQEGHVAVYEAARAALDAKEG